MLSSIQLTNNGAQSNKDSVPFHRDVYEAILQKDEEQAETNMILLLDDASDRIQTLFNMS